MNTKTYALIAAASLGVSGLCFAQQTPGQQESQQSQQPAQMGSQNEAQQAGATIEGSQSLMQQFPREGVKNVQQQKNEKAINEVAKLADCSLQGDLKTCGQQLTEQSQQRLDLSSIDSSQVRQAADQLKQDFKDKYNQELAINEQAKDIFANADVIVAEVSDPQQLAAQFPLPNNRSQAQQAGYQQQGQSQAGQSNQSQTAQEGTAQNGQMGASAQTASGQSGQQQMQLKQGDKIAAVQLQSSENPSKSVAVSLVQEKGQWRIVPSPEIQSGNQLAQNLAAHMQMADQQKAQWPSDAKQAQAMIARHILMAYSTPPTGASAQQSGFESGSSQQQGQNSQGQAGQTGSQYENSGQTQQPK